MQNDIKLFEQKKIRSIYDEEWTGGDVFDDYCQKFIGLGLFPQKIVLSLESIRQYTQYPMFSMVTLENSNIASSLQNRFSGSDISNN